MSDLESRLRQQVEEMAEAEFLGLEDVENIKTVSPWLSVPEDLLDEPAAAALWIFRKPEYFGATCKHILNLDMPPFQLAILRELWKRPFPLFVASRGAGKSFLLAVYSILKCLFEQGSRVVIVGAAFRQSKMIFEYAAKIWENAPILRDLVSEGSRSGPRYSVDKCSMGIGDSSAIAIPIGDGKKVRGYRASVLISDEFASNNPEIFEEVIQGFSFVSGSPVVKVRERARTRAMKKLGYVVSEEARTGNQSIISGSAYYSFNHFYDYWKRYKAIVESRGDPKALEAIFMGPPPKGFDWRDYSVIRLPAEILPDGYMDEKTLAKSKATIHRSKYILEVGACFISDSDGFFRRSLIERCVVGRGGERAVFLDGEEIIFHPVLRGDPDKQYVIGADPASESDNFAIVVLECYRGHRRVVYCWTTNRKAYHEKRKVGLTASETYYGFCAKKIRSLIRVFPCVRLAMDSQGGGHQVYEALNDSANMEVDERPIWPITLPDKTQETDGNVGEHILELVNFSSADYVAQANHGMKKDLEDISLLFPAFDPIKLELALRDDEASGRVKVDEETGKTTGLYESLEDCVLEIEELKDELSTITLSQTPSGRERWDTPETRSDTGKKGRMRKDRYSALLMANAAGRVIDRTPEETPFRHLGGFADGYSAKQTQGKPYDGPEWFTSKLTTGANLGAAIRRF